MLGKASTVLVTGGTGFTGSFLVRRLLELGCEVRVIARESSNRSAFDGLPVEWIIGDVFDEEIIARACESVQYVFHVAAAFRIAGAADDTYRQVHVESTQLLAKACSASDSFERFVHVSTVGVHGHIESPPADESTPFGPGDIYQDTKAEAELWIREYAQSSGLPLTVVRPAAIYGPGDMRLLKVFKMAKMPFVPIIGFTKGLYHLIHVEDLVSFFVCVANDQRAVGQVYICGNPEATSIQQIIAVVAARLGRRPRFIRIPAWPVFALASACDWVSKLIGVNPIIYPRRVAFFTKDRSFDTSKMRAIEEFSYSYTNDSGLESTCDWYSKNGLL